MLPAKLEREREREREGERERRCQIRRSFCRVETNLRLPIDMVSEEGEEGKVVIFDYGLI